MLKSFGFMLKCFGLILKCFGRMLKCFGRMKSFSELESSRPFWTLVILVYVGPQKGLGSSSNIY